MWLPLFVAALSSVVRAWTYANDGIATMTHYTMSLVRCCASVYYARPYLSFGFHRERLPVAGAREEAHTTLLRLYRHSRMVAMARWDLDRAAVSVFLTEVLYMTNL